MKPKKQFDAGPHIYLKLRKTRSQYRIASALYLILGAIFWWSRWYLSEFSAFDIFLIAALLFVSVSYFLRSLWLPKSQEAQSQEIETREVDGKSFDPPGLQSFRLKEPPPWDYIAMAIVLGVCIVAAIVVWLASAILGH